MDGKVDAYWRSQTLGKSQIDLILQVYDGAIDAYNRAAEHYQAEEFQAGYDQLERAKRFITHLYTTLDFEKGGQIAENLGTMYAYVINETDGVEATKQVEQIDLIVKVLSNIRAGWAGAKENLESRKETVAKKGDIETTSATDSFVTSA